MRQHELEADQQRAGERGELERRLAPRHERDATAPATSSTWRTLLQQVQVGQPGVVLPPVPERERRVAADLPAERPVPEHAAPRASGCGSSRRIENAAARRDDEAGDEAQLGRAAAAAPGSEAQSGATSERRELRPARERRRTRRGPTGDVTSQKPQIRNAGRIASFVFELDA